MLARDLTLLPQLPLVGFSPRCKHRSTAAQFRAIRRRSACHATCVDCRRELVTTFPCTRLTGKGGLYANTRRRRGRRLPRKHHMMKLISTHTEEGHIGRATGRRDISVYHAQRKFNSPNVVRVRACDVADGHVDACRRRSMK